jgi:hypothetical protein
MVLRDHCLLRDQCLLRDHPSNTPCSPPHPASNQIIGPTFLLVAETDSAYCTSLCFTFFARLSANARQRDPTVTRAFHMQKSSKVSPPPGNDFGSRPT